MKMLFDCCVRLKLRQLLVPEFLRFRSAGVNDAVYYGWRKMFSGIGLSKVKEMKTLEKENQRFRKAVSDLTLDKLILQESLDDLKLQ